MRTKTRSWLVVELALLLLFSVWVDGCQKKVVVQNAPTGVSAVGVANWYKATGAFSRVADLLQQVEQTIRVANKTPLADGTAMLPDGEYYQALLRKVGQIALTQRSASEYLKTVPDNFGQPVQAQVAGYSKAIQGFVQDLLSLGVTGIKDKNTQQVFETFISEIGSTVTFVLSFSSADNRLQAFPLLEYDQYVEMKEVFVV